MAPRSAAAGGVADAHRASGPRASSFEAPRWSFFLSRPPLERAQEPSFLFQWAPQSPSDCAVPMRYHGAQERGSGGRGKVLVPRLGDGWVHCAHGAVVCVVELPSCCCPPGTRPPPHQLGRQPLDNRVADGSVDGVPQWSRVAPSIGPKLPVRLGQNPSLG